MQSDVSHRCSEALYRFAKTWKHSNALGHAPHRCAPWLMDPSGRKGPDLLQVVTCCPLSFHYCTHDTHSFQCISKYRNLHALSCFFIIFYPVHHCSQSLRNSSAKLPQEPDRHPLKLPRNSRDCQTAANRRTLNGKMDGSCRVERSWYNLRAEQTLKLPSDPRQDDKLRRSTVLHHHQVSGESSSTSTVLCSISISAQLHLLSHSFVNDLIPQNRFWAKLRPSRIYEEHCCPIPGTLPLLEMLLLPPCTTLHWCAKWHCPAFANGGFSTRNHCPGLLRMKGSQEKDKTSHNNFAHRGVERETDWHGSWCTTHLYCSWRLPLGCPPSQVGQWKLLKMQVFAANVRETAVGAL